MATDSQRRMLIRPLMKRRPDLAYHRQYVFIRPLTHYLRGVYFCPGRWSNDVELEPFAFPLFGGGDTIYLASGKLADGRRAFSYYHRGDWQQDPEGTSKKVCEVIEHEALPEIADLTSPEALAAQPGYGYHLEYKVLNPCFYGDFDEAEKAVDEYLQYWTDRYPSDRLISKTKVGSTVTYTYAWEVFSIDLATEEHKFDSIVQRRMAYLGKLLKTDRSRIPALLHDWEAFSVNALKLHKYWTPTPFPCER